jgi:hypothetical protein
MEPVSSLSYYLELQKQMSYLLKISPEYDAEQRPYQSATLWQSAEESAPAGCTRNVEVASTQSRGDGDMVEQITLQRALVEMAEETRFDWPEFLPVERVKAGLAEAAVGLLLLAGLIAVGSLFILSPTFLS